MNFKLLLDLRYMHLYGDIILRICGEIVKEILISHNHLDSLFPSLFVLLLTYWRYISLFKIYVYFVYMLS